MFCEVMLCDVHRISMVGKGGGWGGAIDHFPRNWCMYKDMNLFGRVEGGSKFLQMMGAAVGKLNATPVGVGPSSSKISKSRGQIVHSEAYLNNQ